MAMSTTAGMARSIRRWPGVLINKVGLDAIRSAVRRGCWDSLARACALVYRTRDDPCLPVSLRTILGARDLCTSRTGWTTGAGALALGLPRFTWDASCFRSPGNSALHRRRCRMAGDSPNRKLILAVARHRRRGYRLYAARADRELLRLA